jgi:CHAT domain-containing protein
VRFYEGLVHGRPRDEALRDAQLALLRGSEPATRHPLYWAAFELTGTRR